MAVDPRGVDLKTLLAEDPGGPVVMLNLLRFAPDGRPFYDEYVRHLENTFLRRYGAQVVYAGSGGTALVAEDGQAWDAVILVRYPSRQAFSRMVADPDYQAVTGLRSRALTEAVLQPTVEWCDHGDGADGGRGVGADLVGDGQSDCPRTRSRIGASVQLFLVPLLYPQLWLSVAICSISPAIASSTGGRPTWCG